MVNTGGYLVIHPVVTDICLVFFLLTCCLLVLRDCSSSDACCFSVSFNSTSVKFTSDTFCTHTWMYFLWGSGQMSHVRSVYEWVQ